MAFFNSAVGILQTLGGRFPGPALRILIANYNESPGSQTLEERKGIAGFGIAGVDVQDQGPDLIRGFQFRRIPDGNLADDDFIIIILSKVFT